MDENGTALALATIALILACVLSKQLDRLRRDVNCLVDGDAETVKLRRKLEGWPGGRDDG